jgi:hypothetical protein
VKLHLSPLRSKKLPQTFRQSQEGTALELAACCQCRERRIFCLQTKKTKGENERKEITLCCGYKHKGIYSDTGKNRLSRLEKKRRSSYRVLRNILEVINFKPGH